MIHWALLNALALDRKNDMGKKCCTSSGPHEISVKTHSLLTARSVPCPVPGASSIPDISDSVSQPCADNAPKLLLLKQER